MPFLIWSLPCHSAHSKMVCNIYIQGTEEKSVFLSMGYQIMLQTMGITLYSVTFEILSIKISLLWSQCSYFVCVLLCVSVYFVFAYLVLTLAPLSSMQVLSCFAGSPKSLYQESKWSLFSEVPSFAASEGVSPSSLQSFALSALMKCVCSLGTAANSGTWCRIRKCRWLNCNNMSSLY